VALSEAKRFDVRKRHGRAQFGTFVSVFASLHAEAPLPTRNSDIKTKSRVRTFNFAPELPPKAVA